MTLSEEELNAFLRDDFEEFIARSFSELNPGEQYMPNWHIRVIAQALEEVRSGKIKRLIINVPPRSLKSIAASVALSAWILGHDPSKKIICASYSQDLADKHADDTRTVMGSDFYRRLFPSTHLAPSRRSVNQLTTTAHGLRLATSVGGSITGHGADIIIIDDPIKSGDALSPDQMQKVNDWYTDSVPSRLNSSDGAIIMVMQRFHEHDLVEFVQRKEEWKVVSLPAIAAEDESYAIRSPYVTENLTRNIGGPLHPERASREALHALYFQVGKANFYAQYQQAPIRLEDPTETDDGWPEGVPDDFDMVLQSWNVSPTTDQACDRCAGSLWGIKEEKLYLISFVQCPLPQDEAMVLIDAMAKALDANMVLLEDSTPGQRYAAALRPKYDVQLSRMKITKKERIRMAIEFLASDRVVIPQKASWRDPFRLPLLVFSESREFDGEDSVAQALYWFQNRLPRTKVSKRRVPPRPRAEFTRQRLTKGQP